MFSYLKLGKVRTRIFLLFSIFLSFGTLGVAEEIRNDEGVFAESDVCGAYENFLEGGGPETTTACHPVAKFLIENQSLDYLQFLKEINRKFGSGNFLDLLASGLQGVLFRDASETFLWMDHADRFSFTTFDGVTRDEERALFYSLLISDQKYQAIQSLCDPEADCETLKLFSSAKELLGIEYSWVDETRPDHMLMCLIRTDAFLVPVRSVLDSPKFSDCILILKGE